MTPLAQETRRLLAVCQQQGCRIEVPPRVPPSSFKSTPGPANGVPYVSPYRQQYRDRPTKPVQAPPTPAPKGNRKEDGLYILAPVTPRPRAYLDDGERRKQAYRARKEQGLCAKCDQPGVVKKNGKRAAFCAKHLAAGAAYRQRRREGG